MSLKDSYFTVSEVAKELGVTRQTISRWIADGKLVAETIGREKLIDKKQVGQAKRLNVARLTKVIATLIGDIIKREYYSEADKIEAVGDDWIVTKSDGTMEKVEVPKIIITMLKGKKAIKIEVQEIVRNPYKKEGK